MHYGEDAMKRAAGAGASLPGTGGPSPLNRTRSLSACERTSPKLSCSPEVVQGTKKTSKDDSSLDGVKQPETPRQPAVRRSNLSLQMFADGTVSPFTAANTQFRATPLSPKLDHSQIYASPTPPNMLPRRSRGLDFSRAATSLHHSTLAESSPDSSPIVGAGHAMDIPNRRGGHSGTEQTSSSLWSIMGTQEKANMSSSVGSTRHAVASNTSTSSEDEELMDEDTDEAFVGTPQFSRSGRPGAYFGSPSTGSIMSFQQRQRPRKQAKKKATKGLGPLALGFGGNTTPKSPPNNARQVRRESISWQANQLHISPTEGDDGATDSGSGDGQGVVVRRAVTRRGNMLVSEILETIGGQESLTLPIQPKTKTFARIKAVLVEESAPAEAECRREAEVVRQVRESDAAPEPRLSGQGSEPAGCLSALSSPNLKGNQESLNDIPEDDMIGEISAGLSSSFKQHAMKTAKRRAFWDTFSESSSMGGARTPPAAVLPRGSSSGISEDVAMDSPSLLGQSSSMVSSSMVRFIVGAESRAFSD